MIFDSLLLFTIYFLSIFSIAGYGKITTFFFNKKKINDIFELFFLGLPLLLILGFLNYVVIGYSKYLNIIVLLFGFFYYFYFYKINLKVIQKLAFPLLLILGILVSKTHEDFHLYHYQHLKELTDGTFKLGMANLDSFVRYSYSSLFTYIQGYFYLPYFELKLFHVPVYLVYVSLCSYLYTIYNEPKVDKKTKFFSVIVLIVLVIKFSRLSEFGYDYISQFLLIFIFFHFLKNSKGTSSALLTLLFIFAISVKITSIFFFPLIVYMLLKNQSLNGKSFGYNNLKGMVLIFLIILTILGNSFFKTGCFFYGVKFSCLNKSTISWSVNYDKIEEHREIAIKWSKGFYHTGSGAFQKDNPKYISEEIYAWAPYWFKNHFRHKILDFLAVFFIALSLVFWSIKRDSLRKLKNQKKYNFSFILASFLSFFIWFSVLPQFRFGFASIFLLILSLAALFVANIKKINLKKINYIILISILIFNFKNVDRIYKEINRNDFYRYSNFPWFWLPERNFQSKKFYNSDDLYYLPSGLMSSCFNVPTPCAFKKNKLIIRKEKYLREYITISNVN